METILVVDDETPVRALARDILLGAGYRVLEAEDGEQALRVGEEHRGTIHVLLTDVVMPGINGKELADRLAAVRTDTKTIFMSGCASEVVSDAGVLIPVDAFVAKPFTVERLLNKVRERIEYCSPFPRPRAQARRPDPSGTEMGPAATATPD
jgi:two-component system, cell cycle sensor histidine kinase and response regulator CckA